MPSVRQAEMNRSTVAVGIIALTIGAGTPAGTSKPFGGSFNITLLRQDHFWEREIEVFVDADSRGTAHVRATGDSRGDPWNRNNYPLDADCQLDAKLVGELRTLLQKADVFGYQGSGRDIRGMHFPLDTLFISDAGRTVAAVISFNDLYKQGVRNRLVTMVLAINGRLATTPAPEACTLDSLNLTAQYWVP
jgi:hypothetical protein